MKLRNLLLTATLFVVAGAVFAQNPNAVAPFDLVSFDSYALNVAQQEGYKATSTLNVTRIRMNGNGGGSNGSLAGTQDVGGGAAVGQTEQT